MEHSAFRIVGRDTHFGLGLRRSRLRRRQGINGLQQCLSRDHQRLVHHEGNHVTQIQVAEPTERTRLPVCLTTLRQGPGATELDGTNEAILLHERVHWRHLLRQTAKKLRHIRRKKRQVSSPAWQNVFKRKNGNRLILNWYCYMRSL